MVERRDESTNDLAEDIVAANPIFKDENLKSTLSKWVEVRDAVDKKYPNKSEIAKAELIGKIMKRLKITNISGKLR